jgi:hypothetical protein
MGQHATVRKFNRMAVVKHSVEINIIGCVVADERIARARVTAQGSAQGDVDFLKTAANAKDGLARVNHAVDHGHCDLVAAVIERTVAAFVTIKPRCDI